VQHFRHVCRARFDPNSAPQELSQQVGTRRVHESQAGKFKAGKRRRRGCRKQAANLVIVS
jgi:hypothetical protein